jgi:CBS domain containing-hemolysin-like protein
MFRTIGGTVGTAVMGGVMNATLAAGLAAGLTQPEAFTKAVDHVFFLGSFAILAAFVLVWFIPQISLRRSNRPALEEVGIEMGESLGEQDARHA